MKDIKWIKNKISEYELELKKQKAMYEKYKNTTNLMKSSSILNVIFDIDGKIELLKEVLEDKE
jgi:hypothetical protein